MRIREGDDDAGECSISMLPVRLLELERERFDAVLGSKLTEGSHASGEGRVLWRQVLQQKITQALAAHHSLHLLHESFGGLAPGINVEGAHVTVRNDGEDGHELSHAAARQPQFAGGPGSGWWGC